MIKYLRTYLALFLCFFLTITGSVLNAQQDLGPAAPALSGTYIVGTGQPAPFNTITNAVARINADGVSGPVTFLLKDDAYTNTTGESFPIKISQFPGTSTTNTLTIKPNANKSVTITGKNINTYTGLPAVFQIDGGDNIIFDGSNIANGSSRNLTIVNADDVSYVPRTTLWISSNASNGATNIKVLNLKLQMTNRNQDYLQLSGIFSGSNSRDGSNGVSGTPATAANSNFTVENNEFVNTRQGLIVNGSTTAGLRTSNVKFSSNILLSIANSQKQTVPISLKNINSFDILDNRIDDFLSSNTLSLVFTGIDIENCINFNIKRNTITGLKMNSNSGPAFGIRIRGLSTGGVISDNKIYNLKNTSAGHLCAVELDLNNTTNFLMANNFISDIAVNTNNVNDTDNGAYGIYIKSGTGTQVYHNTVAMNTAQPGLSAAIFFAGGTDLNTVQNNIFTNTGTIGNPYAVYSIAGSDKFTTINYNDYYAPKIGFLGLDKVTLAEWQTATGKDKNSLNVLPNFTSVSDLHLIPATNTGIDNKGQFLATVPQDIDGQLRNIGTAPNGPDMGADEFSVLATEPGTQTTKLSFTNVAANSFNINLTNLGGGANRVVVIRSGSAVNSPPVDATAYTANTTFGSGSQIGTGNYVVYGGTANTVTVTGLSAATTYYVSVYEYNGTGPTANYLITNPLTGNQKTLNANLGWQIKNVNIQSKITFDETVSGVNNGSYSGTGFLPTPGSGQLDSNGWSVEGFEDGAIAFGGINTNPDFGHGTANGAVTNGGIYAFETSPNNQSLGIQPSTTDFTPGSATLRFQNQNTAPITSISIGYKVYIYNDEAGSSSFNFSHSADNSAYTTISELDVTSPATAETNPSWNASYRVATITGLNIPANGFYYLKWTGNKITPNGPYDQFGLDDIVLSANPTTVFADFNGTAENFSVHGNTGLSGNLTVNGDLKLTAGKLSVGTNTLTLGGTVINTIAGGISGSANSNITIINNGDKTLSFDQTTAGSTNLFNNFSVPYAASVSKTVSVDNPFAVNGALNVGLDQTLDFKQNALGGNISTITINGTVLTQNTSATPFPANKIWGGTGILHLNAETSAQNLVAGTYTNLTLSSPTGSIANANVTVNGILDLPSANPTAIAGSLSITNPFVITMGPGGTNTGVGDVSGIIARNTILPNVLYTFGHQYSSILFSNVGTLPEWMKVKVVIGQNNWRTGAIKRYYDITQYGANDTKAIIRQHYLESELNANIESKLVNWGQLVPTLTFFEQGRSNINTVENWVEITNANLGNYFQADFDKVYITLDQTEASVLTWNGEQGNSWTTTGNWTANDGTKTATPSLDTKVIIPNVSPKPQPILNPTTQVLSIEIQEGAVVQSTPSDVFEIYGTSGAWINNGGLFNAPNGTGKVIFKTLDATISGSTTFNNLEIGKNASLRALDGNYMSIAGTLVNNGLMSVALIPNTIEFTGNSQVIPLPGGQDRNGYHHLTISGTNAGFPANLNVRGNLILNQIVELAGKTINLTGDTNQKIGGTVHPVFNNLTINNTGPGVTLNTAATVNGVLKLTAGHLNIATFDLTLGQNAVEGTFNTTSMIVADGSGFVRRPYSGIGSYVFPIGELTSSPAYSPITVDVTAGTFSDAFVNVSVVDAIHPNNYSLQNYISRYWNVKQTGITGAVATIAATYVTPELLVPAETMIAAQLTGTFNAETNPWVRFAPLSGLTLTATGASLAANEVSVFTGIKGGDFVATITGGDTTCQNDGVTLTAEVTGGDMEYTYLWSATSEPNLGTESTFTPSQFIGTKEYTLTVTDANGRKTTSTKKVTTVASAVPGTISENQTVCFSYAPQPISVEGNTAVIYWERSDNPSFTNPVRIQNTNTTLTGEEAGEIIGTTYFRAAFANGSCSPVYSTALIMDIESTEFGATGWSDGEPSITKAAIISQNITLNKTLIACNLIITNGAKVVVPAGMDVLLNASVIVDEGSTLTFESDTNLVQTANEPNFGVANIKRESSKLFRLDYTMWGSPMEPSQTLKNFSPKTLSNRFYDYNSNTDLFQVINPTTSVFTSGKGYLIRMPDNHVAFGAGDAQSWTGIFTGTPATGNIAIPLDPAKNGFNMISNPYASMIKADQFLTANAAEIEGTLYFWRRRNAIPDNSAYYATYTSAGGTGTAGSTSAPSQIPNGFIQVGQGFIVKKETTAPVTGKALFTNAMRTATNNENQIFKNGKQEDRHRIWLNVSNSAGEFGQTLVAYMPSATNEVDRTDGKYLGDGSTALTSWFNDTRYIIQGRAPFSTSDVVPLNFETASAGNYTIAIDHVDGLFEVNQEIYLRDRFQSVTHNLKNASYTFETAAGSFNSRFELVYETGTLVVDNPVFDSNSVSLYKKGGNLIIKSKITTLDKVEVFDFAGRLLATAKNINSKEVSMQMTSVNQVLIVKITSTDGMIISKKIIN